MRGNIRTSILLVGVPALELLLVSCYEKTILRSLLILGREKIANSAVHKTQVVIYRFVAI